MVLLFLIVFVIMVYNKNKLMFVSIRMIFFYLKIFIMEFKIIIFLKVLLFYRI